MRIAVRIFLSLFSLVLVCAASAVAFAQLPKAQKSTPKTAPKRPAPADEELDKRIAAARAARGSADLLAAAQANKKVISLALQQLGRLRLVESAFPQAIEIYRR